MRFGPVPVAEAEGAILAHSLMAEGAEPDARGRRLRKGRVLSAGDVADLKAAGLESVVVARLEPGDVPEDEAARRLAAAAAGPGLEASKPFTGRVNLFADVAGLALFDVARLDAVNLVDEAVTVATLPAYAVVEPRQMVATVKIVSFAVPEAVVAAAEAAAREAGPLLQVAPFRRMAVGLVQTVLHGTKDGLLDKTRDVTGARLKALGCRLAGELRCAHEEEALAAAMERLLDEGCALLLVVGASAITDRRDVIPAALVRIGGEIEHFGMPVDPGQLLLLGRKDLAPVLGVPGCGRSPKVNGFDWVLQRLVAGLPLAGRDIMRMGAGGLLAEIETRPAPRAEPGPKPAPRPQRAPRIAALVLAAGQSRRMGAANKLLAEIDGVPMVARVVDAALASRAEPVVVVLGHEAARVREALGRKRRALLVENKDYAEGLSTSLARGIAALPEGLDGALVCLGDMPRVRSKDIDRLIEAFNPIEGRAIVVPTHRGKRGNPVLFASRYFAEMTGVAGDVGARHLIGSHGEEVVEVEVEDDSVLIDVDTPDALAAFRAGTAAG